MSYIYIKNGVGYIKNTLTQIQKAAVIEGLAGAIANYSKLLEGLKEQLKEIEAQPSEENSEFVARIDKGENQK